MNEESQIENGMGTLADDARTLMGATADVAGEEVSRARRRLAQALEGGKEFYVRFRNKAIQGTKATDEVVRAHPYQAMGIALAVGAILGILVGRRSCDD